MLTEFLLNTASYSPCVFAYVAPGVKGLVDLQLVFCNLYSGVASKPVERRCIQRTFRAVPNSPYVSGKTPLAEQL